MTINHDVNNYMIKRDNYETVRAKYLDNIPSLSTIEYNSNKINIFIPAGISSGAIKTGNNRDNYKINLTECKIAHMPLKQYAKLLISILSQIPENTDATINLSLLTCMIASTNGSINGTKESKNALEILGHYVTEDYQFAAISKKFKNIILSGPENMIYFKETESNEKLSLEDLIGEIENCLSGLVRPSCCGYDKGFADVKKIVDSLHKGSIKPSLRDSNLQLDKAIENDPSVNGQGISSVLANDNPTFTSIDIRQKVKKPISDISKMLRGNNPLKNYCHAKQVKIDDKTNEIICSKIKNLTFFDKKSVIIEIVDILQQKKEITVLQINEIVLKYDTVSKHDTVSKYNTPSPLPFTP